MRGLVKLLLATGLGAALSACVVAPAYPPRAYVRVGVVAPAPVVVYGGGYYYRGGYDYRRW